MNRISTVNASWWAAKYRMGAAIMRAIPAMKMNQFAGRITKPKTRSTFPFNGLAMHAEYRTGAKDVH